MRGYASVYYFNTVLVLKCVSLAEALVIVLVLVIVLAAGVAPCVRLGRNQRGAGDCIIAYVTSQLRRVQTDNLARFMSKIHSTYEKNIFTKQNAISYNQVIFILLIAV